MPCIDGLLPKWYSYAMGMGVVLPVCTIGSCNRMVTTIWKVEIFRHEDYFLLRTVTLRTRKIQYCECISFKLGANSLTLKTSMGTFHIDCRATNFEFLMAMLAQHKVKGIQ